MRYANSSDAGGGFTEDMIHPVGLATDLRCDKCIKYACGFYPSLCNLQCGHSGKFCSNFNPECKYQRKIKHV